MRTILFRAAAARAKPKPEANTFFFHPKVDVEVNDALVRGSFVSELGLLPRLSSLRFDNNLLTGAPPLITSANFGKYQGFVYPMEVLCQTRPDLLYIVPFASAFLSASNNLLAGPLPPLSVILHSGKSLSLSAASVASSCLPQSYLSWFLFLQKMLTFSPTY